jgi:acetyl esterase/lipase
MTASVLLVVLGLLAVLGFLNALRPLRTSWGLGPAWLAAWITVELAPHLLVFGALAGAVLVVLGALDEPIGWIGLGALLVAEAGAIPLVLRARRTVVELDGVTSELDPSEPESPYPRSHIVFPWLMLRRRGVRVVRGVEYARHGNLRLRLDVYLPRAPAERPRPAIVEVHGGGWIMGSRREQAIPLLTHLAANGWVGFNIDYRLSPRATFPDHVVDVKRAIAWVREHAEEYGVDPSFIALTGGSAGGHLCALAALTAGDPTLQPGFEEADASVAAAVPFYGAYDLLDEDGRHAPLVHRLLERWVFKVRRRDDPQRFRAASPMHRVHADAPPMLVIHGERDSMLPVEEARLFADRLREASDSPVLYAEMRGGQHAFDLIPSWRTVPVIDAIERFLATVRRRRGDQSTSSRSLASDSADAFLDSFSSGASSGVRAAPPNSAS